MRILASLAAVSLLVTAANAQCFEQSFGVLCTTGGVPNGYGDDVFFDLQPMNITFPMGGLAASYTHAHVCSNGVIYLTNGVNSNGSTYAYQPTTYMVGAVGQDPRIAPLWIDLESVAANGGGVYFNNTIPGKFVVTWANTVEWAVQTPIFTIQAQLFSNGDVIFYYSSSVYGISSGAAPQFVARCGVSEGNGVGDPGSVDLSAGNSNLASFVMYEEFPLNVFDLQDRSVTFVYVGTGYVQTSGPCTPALHENYGSGCYDFSNSFYQYLPNATTAPAVLDGQSLSMTRTGSEYLVTWGGGTYVPPVAGTNLVLTDDGEVAQATSIAFPSPTGPINPLFIGANGVVSMAANTTANQYVPDENSFLNSAVTAFYSWHDFNPAEAGSGPVVYHEGVVAGETIAYFTWDNVENYPLAVVNPSRLQFQLNLTTGSVKIVWVTMDSSIASTFGTAHLVGWSPGGPSTDGGSLNLATTPPFLTMTANIFGLSLSASPAPVSSATVGTMVTYTTNNMRQFVTGSGVYVGLHILSVTPIPLGLSLAFLPAPGCNAYVGTLDLPQAMVGASPTNAVSIILPTLLPPGTEIYSQSICLIPPGSLPNGQNGFGILSSNGVRTYISNF